jgi:hypothetical protein
MKKYIYLFLLIPFFSYANIQNLTDNELTKGVQGIWAMTPLKGGIANVMHNDKNKSILYSFKCDWKTKQIYFEGLTENTFDIKDGIFSVTEKGKTQPYTSLKITSITSGVIKMLYDDEFEFNYIKMDHITPLCPIYWDSANK